MTLLLSLTIGALFGFGASLMLKRDLIRVTAGIMLISSAALLVIMGAQLSQGRAPIYPVASPQQVSDPLGQALALTAIVISFGVMALLLSLVYRVFTTHQTLDSEILELAERQERDNMRETRECL